jgi:transcriptional regulator with XRE-family HTH domain
MANTVEQTAKDISMNASHSMPTREPCTLLKMFRIRPRPGKAKKLTQQALATLIQRDPRSIREWESGMRLPSPESLMQLIQVYVHEHVFVQGKEKEEAQCLWETVSSAAQHTGRSNSYPPFDENWFGMILQKREGASVTISTLVSDENGQEQTCTTSKQLRYVSWWEPMEHNAVEEMVLYEGVSI